jgi:hypothetical protein
VSAATHAIWRDAPVEIKVALRCLITAEHAIIVSGNRMESVCTFLYDRAFPIDTDAEVLRAMLALMDPEGTTDWSHTADPTCRKWMDVYNLYNQIRSRAKHDHGDWWLHAFRDLGLTYNGTPQPRCSVCEDMHPNGEDCDF